MMDVFMERIWNKILYLFGIPIFWVRICRTTTQLIAQRRAALPQSPLLRLFINDVHRTNDFGAPGLTGVMGPSHVQRDKVLREDICRQ